jgi:hypothetical protein
LERRKLECYDNLRAHGSLTAREISHRRAIWLRTSPQITNVLAHEDASTLAPCFAAACAAVSCFPKLKSVNLQAILERTESRELRRKSVYIARTMYNNPK